MLEEARFWQEYGCPLPNPRSQLPYREWAAHQAFLMGLQEARMRERKKQEAEARRAKQKGVRTS